MTSSAPRDLASLLEASRFEVIPMSGVVEQVERFLPSGTVLTVTCSPAKGPDRTVELAERLANGGYRVVPHVSARTVQSREHLRSILGRLAAAGISDLFVVGGDGHRAGGAYGTALELLEAIHAEGPVPKEIGIAGYPEGHPLIEEVALQEALDLKAPLATHLATQICFDPGAVARWIATIRARGIHLPIHLGIAGAVNRRRLIEVSLRVGVGPSVKYVSKYGGLVARLMRRGGYRPDGFVNRIEPFVANPGYAIAGFHVFTFNQVEATGAWRHGIVQAYRAAGRPLSELAEGNTAS